MAESTGSGKGLELFSFEGRETRVTMVGGEPWFVARDVVEGVGAIWNGSQAIDHVPQQWRGSDQILTPGGPQKMAVLSEQGVYFYLGRSDKPKALPYQMWLAGDVVPAIRKTGSYSVPATPSVHYHMRRYAVNAKNVPHGYFSVLTAMTNLLIGPLEMEGYILPEKLWPDISEGMMFSAHMKKQEGFDPTEIKRYWHHFEDGRNPVEANCYPKRYMGEFAVHLEEIWIPKRSLGYFTDKDPTAIPFLHKAFPVLIAAPQKKQLRAPK